jgi:hypothetical protein
VNPVVNNAVAAVARATAAEMAPSHGPRLTAAVEAAIQADDGHPEHKTPGQYIDPIALGALIVSIAQFGYQVYTDRKDRGQPPTREAIAQAIRIERRKHSELTGEETEVIDIISAKVIEQGGNQLPSWSANQKVGRPMKSQATAHLDVQLSLDAQTIQSCVSSPSRARHERTFVAHSALHVSQISWRSTCRASTDGGRSVCSVCRCRADAPLPMPRPMPRPTW